MAANYHFEKLHQNENDSATETSESGQFLSPRSSPNILVTITEGLTNIYKYYVKHSRVINYSVIASVVALVVYSLIIVILTLGGMAELVDKYKRPKSIMTIYLLIYIYYYFATFICYSIGSVLVCCR